MIGKSERKKQIWAITMTLSLSDFTLKFILKAFLKDSEN